MGLDMIPMGKPKFGFENRFNQIFKIFQGKEEQEQSTREELLKEWFENQITPYETIKAPRVGRDKEADEWIKKEYKETEQIMSESDYINQYKGYYIIELAKELEGVPMYISINHERNVFKGQFLQDCVDLLGEDLVNEAWKTKLADETLDYGLQLMNIADKIAKENNLLYLKDQRIPPEVEEGTIEYKLHIVYSLARWLIFYGKNGHGYEADF